ncbi:hypothetical protein UlMin_040739 [Ulmus minor]
MNIFSTELLPCQDHHLDGEESIDESSEEREERGGMEMQEEDDSVGVEVDFEIWPVEHPMEPPEEDRPVKCPMPHSSVVNDEGKREKKLAESLRKKAEESATTAAGEAEKKHATMEEEVEGERPVRAVRKRHHNLTRGEEEHVIMPLSRMPPLPPLPTQNLTIFQMLQQFDKFES